MSEDYDPSGIVGVLGRYLKPGSTVLEIGMGPGKHFALLEQNYRVTGSDNSPACLDLLREKWPGADLLNLDAVTLDTGRRFDCLFSNKVFHYLSESRLKESFKRQHALLKPGGIVCHTCWYGEKEIAVKGMRFYYYSEKTIVSCLDPGFEQLLLTTYREMIIDDSLLLILKKK